MNNVVNWQALASAGVVGVFFTCCGWNKLFDPRRSASMRHTMRKYLPGPHLIWWLFVSLSELLLGMIMLVSLAWMYYEPYNWLVHLVMKTSAAGLFTVCAVAFGLVGWPQVCKEWEPTGCLDWTSCVLYKVEVAFMLFSMFVVFA